MSKVANNTVGHVCSSRSVTTHTVCGKGACMNICTRSAWLIRTGGITYTASYSHFCDTKACQMSKLMHANLSQPAWQLFVKVCHCLQQMYFLMKVWGQYVLSQGKRSINNYLPHSWQFLLHPSSTPTAPLFSTYVQEPDYKLQAQTCLL